MPRPIAADACATMRRSPARPDPMRSGSFPLRHSRLAVCSALALALAVAALIALRSGSIALPWRSLLALVGMDGGEPLAAEVLWQLRLPRVLAALLAGAALATAGAAMQGLLRNPLADPGLVGVSAGAGLAAALAMLLAHRLPIMGGLLVPAAAFAGGLLATLLVVRLARVHGRTHVGSLLLAGVAVNAICGAGIGLILQLADTGTLRNLGFWLFGSFAAADWASLAYCAPPMLLAVLLLPGQARALDALLLGETEAGHLGVDTEALKRRVIVLLVLGVGAAVALAGMIGFVGLLVPHLVRLACGPGHRMLLPASALLGGLLLLLADTAARRVAAPLELPIGALTALLGGPCFLWLLVRRGVKGAP